jgi:hypothetical protein
MRGEKKVKQRDKSDFCTRAPTRTHNRARDDSNSIHYRVMSIPILPSALSLTIFRANVGNIRTSWRSSF